MHQYCHFDCYSVLISVTHDFSNDLRPIVHYCQMLRPVSDCLRV